MIKKQHMKVCPVFLRGCKHSLLLLQGRLNKESAVWFRLVSLPYWFQTRDLLSLFSGLLNFLFSLHKCEKEKAHYPSRLSSSSLINTFVSQVWRLRLGTNSSESHRVTREGTTASLCPKIPQTQHSSCSRWGRPGSWRDDRLPPAAQTEAYQPRTSWNRDVSSKWTVFPDLHRLYIEPELNMTFKLSLIHL